MFIIRAVVVAEIFPDIAYSFEIVRRSSCCLKRSTDAKVGRSKLEYIYRNISLQHTSIEHLQVEEGIQLLTAHILNAAEKSIPSPGLWWPAQPKEGLVERGL